MIKKIFLAIIAISLLLAGCGKASPANAEKQKEQSSIAATAANSAASVSSGKNTAINSIDYSQYIKKTWIKEFVSKSGIDEKVYYSISEIKNGKITGKFSAINFTSTNRNLLSFESSFEGTVNKNIAECTFNDSKGNKGNLKLVFVSKNSMEAAISLTAKSKTTIQPPDGTYKFEPDNIKNIKGFSLIKSQSFMVNLNSWGNVKFVSGKLTAGNHIPVVFYLTNIDGDILYDFVDDEAVFPYGVDVKAVSFKDVNKDGLKDIIIIVTDSYGGSGKQIAAVILQNNDGSFSSNFKLDQEINNSGNNRDIKTIIKYISPKF